MRSIAAGLAFAMAIASFRVHWRNGLLGQGSYAYSLSLMAAALGLVGASPGKLSLAHLAMKRVKPLGRRVVVLRKDDTQSRAA